MRLTRPPVAASLAALLLLSGCGTGADSAGGTAAGASPTAFTCPTESTQTFSKARFVLNVGLAAGAFHQWIWKPYQAGGFKQGADGRTANLVKAGLAAAFAAKQLKDASDNVKNDPQLCAALGEPLARLGTTLDELKGKLASGDLSSLASIEALVASVLGAAQSQGLKIVEQTPESLVG